MRLGQYMMDVGDLDGLTEHGETLVHFDYLSGGHRTDITKSVIAKNPLKTFRDYDNASDFYSLHTGTKSNQLV